MKSRIHCEIMLFTIEMGVMQIQTEHVFSIPSCVWRNRNYGDVSGNRQQWRLSSPGRVPGTHNQGASLDNSARWEHYGSWLLIEHYNTQYCFKIRNTRCSYNFQLELRRRLQNTVDHLRVIIFVFRFVQAKACLLIYIYIHIYICVCVLYIRASTWCTFSAMTKIKMLNLMCQDASLPALLL